ncbi:MAG: hypothetical protein ACK4Y9_13410 [Hyphomonas sp.]
MNENVAPNDLQFLEYSQYIERALNSKGMTRVLGAETPDIIVLVGYGIGAPEKNTRSYTIPVFGQTGISSSSTTGTATTNVYGTSTYATGNTNYRQTTTYTPTYGVTGYQTGVQNYTTYARYISLNAAFVDIEKDASDWQPAFETNIVSSGSSGDLRQVFPIMIAAAKDSIGISTPKAVQISISENDDAVQFIQGAEK